MDELVTWLRAALDGDTARAVYRQWHAEDCETIPGPDGYSYPCECGVPEWMLRDIAAKRAIVDLAATPPPAPGERAHSSHLYDLVGTFNEGCSTCNGVGSGYLRERVLPQMAAAYSDRPGYRPEWVPS
jgi:hypothetical protein